jgi:hypothetical protein
MNNNFIVDFPEPSWSATTLSAPAGGQEKFEIDKRGRRRERKEMTFCGRQLLIWVLF